MKRWTWASIAFLLGLSLLLVDSTPTQAKSHGNSKRGWLGVEVQSVDEELAEAFKLKSEYGAVVNDISNGSPAEEAGLEESDVIIKVNNERIVDADDLSETISDLKPGDKVTITLIRDGKEKQVEATLEREPGASRYYYGNATPRAYSNSWSMPAMPDIAPIPPIPPIPAIPRWGRSAPGVYTLHDDGEAASGLEVIELTKGLQEFLGVTSRGGAFVTDVERHSTAADAGMKAGDVIIKAGNEKIVDPDDLFETLSDIDEGDTVALTVIRDKKELTVKMEVEEDDFHGVRSFSSGFGSRNAPRMKGLFFGDATGASDYDAKDLAESMEQLAQLRAEMKNQKHSGELDALQKDMKRLREQLQELEAKMK